MPVGFNDFKHHVVLQVLNKVQHPLPQGKRRGVPARGVESEQLSRLVTQPDTATAP